MVKERLSTAEKEAWDERYRTTPYQELPWYSRTPWPEVVRAVGEHWWIPGSRIIDIGCGAGSNSLYLARSGFHVTGVDISDAAIAAARERAAKAGLKIDFQVADVLDLPFKDDHFGGAVDIGCFHTLSESKRRAYSREIGRVIHARRALSLSWIAREHTAELGPPNRLSVEDVTTALEPEFLFQSVEYLPTASGGRRRGPMPMYAARLGRRSFPQAPPWKG